MPNSAVGDLARRNQFSTRRDHAAHCFCFLLSPLLLARMGIHGTARWTTRARKGEEEILRSERNGVPVMGSPGISLKCRGLSIIRGQPLLHRASRSAGDEVRKERKEGGVRWKRTQAKRARSSPPFLFSFFLSLLFVFSFSLVSRTACPEEKKSPMEIRDFKGHAIPRSKLKKDRENIGKPGICTIVPSCRRFNFWTRWNLEKQNTFCAEKNLILSSLWVEITFVSYIIVTIVLSEKIETRFLNSQNF